MSAGEITLVQAVFGLGNQQHDHVHRHNMVNMDSNYIDMLKMEQLGGGVSGTTLAKVAQLSGGLTIQPQGYVSVEDGFNVRRGIGLLRFHVTGNAMTSEELSVVGYLTGGFASAEGIAPETMFVPVRAWSIVSQQKADGNGMPMVHQYVDSSHQFLMGDPHMIKQLKSIRPMDVANEALGMLAAEADGSEERYDGVIGTDLSKQMVVSKTQNLNTSHHARELLKLATFASDTSDNMGLEMGIADNINAPGINEIGLSENAFFRTMMHSTMMHTTNGFAGFSVGEIAGVFTNFADVFAPRLLNTSSFAEDNTLLTSSQYGSAASAEVIASELAMLTVHLLLQVGLGSVAFSATNNPNDFNGIAGSDDGVVLLPGPAMSLLNHDDSPEQRVERFFSLLKTHFFSKYTNVPAIQRTVMNLTVDSHMFGETKVTISFDGDFNNAREFSNATYMINRTSTNIAGTEVGMQASKNYINNIKDYFV